MRYCLNLVPFFYSSFFLSFFLLPFFLFFLSCTCRCCRSRAHINSHSLCSRSDPIIATSPCSWFVCLLVGCLTSQQHTNVSQGRICTDNFTCCHAETEAADQTFSLTQSPYTDTGPTSPSADPRTPGS